MLISCLTVTRPGRLEALARSLRCFARQTYAEREMVLVHDGDAEFDLALRDLLAGFPDQRIRLQRAAQGTPLGALRNLSVRCARGELVCQWDDDDLYHPARLAVQYRTLVEGQGDFCFLTDQLHWFRNTGEFFWDDWTVEPWPMNLIQGTLLGRRALLPAYPEVARGEDTLLLQAVHRGAAGLIGLGDHGYLYIYTFSGDNAWNLAHHAAISQWKRLRREALEARRELLGRELRKFDLALPRARFPHDTGALLVELGAAPGGSVEERPGE